MASSSRNSLIDTPEKLYNLIQVRNALDANKIPKNKDVLPILDMFKPQFIYPRISHLSDKAIPFETRVRQYIDDILQEWVDTNRDYLEKLKLDDSQLISQLRTHNLDVLTEIFLLDPRNIENLELQFELHITGQRDQFIENWRRQDYRDNGCDSSEFKRCLEVVVDVCDVDKFQQMYPLLIADRKLRLYRHIIKRTVKKDCGDILKFIVEEPLFKQIYDDDEIEYLRNVAVGRDSKNCLEILLSLLNGPSDIEWIIELWIRFGNAASIKYFLDHNKRELSNNFVVLLLREASRYENSDAILFNLLAKFDLNSILDRSYAGILGRVSNARKFARLVEIRPPTRRNIKSGLRHAGRDANSVAFYLLLNYSSELTSDEIKIGFDQYKKGDLYRQEEQSNLRTKTVMEVGGRISHKVPRPSEWSLSMMYGKIHEMERVIERDGRATMTFPA